MRHGSSGGRADGLYCRAVARGDRPPGQQTRAAGQHVTSCGQGDVSTAFSGVSVRMWAGDRPGLAKGGDRWSLLHQQRCAPRATAGSAPG
jgi:hypothetical protein